MVTAKISAGMQFGTATLKYIAMDGALKCFYLTPPFVLVKESQMGLNM